MSCIECKFLVVSVMGKGAEKPHQVKSQETNASEPLTTCRKRSDGIKIGRASLAREESGRKPAYSPDGARHEGGVNCD